MNSRLTIQDLAGLLAERTGKDRNSAEQFLREFIAIVSQGVFTDKMTKVKGLGTFKIVLVEKRESIHVNTGERFTIPPHYKFSFLPDKELRELVNKPFSFFETTELNEDVDFTDLDISNGAEEKESEDESVEEILPENEEAVSETPQLQPIAEEVSAPEETVAVTEPDLQTTGSVGNKVEELTEESIEPEQAEVKETEDPGTVEETEEKSSVPETTETVEESSGQPDEEIKQPVTSTGFSETDYQFEDEKPAESHWMKVWVSLGIVTIIAVSSFFLYQNRSFFLGPEKPKALTGQSLPETAIALPDTTQVEETKVTESTTVAEEKPDTTSTVSSNQTAEPTVQTPKVLAKVKIEPGSRLTLISLEYYGSKIFWVYLYEFNKSVIKDPNNVPGGTEIQVPAAEVYGIDRYSRASVDKAAARQTEILSGNL